MMNVLLILPLLVPLTTTVACLFCWRHRVVQRWINVTGAAGLLAASVVLLLAVRYRGSEAVQIGAWPAPFGITLVADLLSAIMVVLAGIIGLAVAVYSLAGIDHAREDFGYYPLLHILLMGVCGAFLTGDMFNLYVWFEVALISSFALMALGGERPQLEGAVKYVALNLLCSAFLLAAVGLLYGAVGTLNMADAAAQLRSRGPRGADTALAVLFLVAFGIKAAVFPLFFWLPASYHTPPAPVSALFAGLLTKVGVYAIIRVFTLLFVGDVGFTHTLILVIAGLTMVTGVLGAVAQHDFRRILSFHIVSQIGYMIMGLGLLSPLAVAGSVFYIAHHIIVKTNLFLVSGIVHRLRGSYDLSRLGGLYATHPGLAILFLVPALSLAGIPPLSGFWAKFVLARAGLELGRFDIVAVALAVSLLTLYSMTKIWHEVFWKPAVEPVPTNLDVSAREPAPAPAEDLRRGAWFALALPAMMLAALTLIIGLAGGPLFALCDAAAAQLLDPQAYTRTVLGVAS